MLRAELHMLLVVGCKVYVQEHDDPNKEIQQKIKTSKNPYNLPEFRSAST